MLRSEVRSAPPLLYFHYAPSHVVVVVRDLQVSGVDVVGGVQGDVVRPPHAITATSESGQCLTVIGVDSTHGGEEEGEEKEKGEEGKAH